MCGGAFRRAVATVLLWLAGSAGVAQQPLPVFVSGQTSGPQVAIAPGGGHAVTWWPEGQWIELWDLGTERDYACVDVGATVLEVRFAAAGKWLAITTGAGWQLRDLTGALQQSWRRAGHEVVDTVVGEVLDFEAAAHAAVTARVVRVGGQRLVLVDRPEGEVRIATDGAGVRLSATGARLWSSAGRRVSLHDAATGRLVRDLDFPPAAPNEDAPQPSGWVEVSCDDASVVVPEVVDHDGVEGFVALKWSSWQDGKPVAEWRVPDAVTVVDYYFVPDGSLCIVVESAEGESSMLRWQPSAHPEPVHVMAPALSRAAIDWDSGTYAERPLRFDSVEMVLGDVRQPGVHTEIRSAVDGCFWLADAGTGAVLDCAHAVVRRWDLGTGCRMPVATAYSGAPIACADAVILREIGGELELSSRTSLFMVQVPGLAHAQQVAVDRGMAHVAVATAEQFWLADVVDGRFVGERTVPRPARPEAAAPPVDGALFCGNLVDEGWCVVDDLGRLEVWSRSGACTSLGTFAELAAPRVETLRQPRPSTDACVRLADGRLLLLVGSRLLALAKDNSAFRSVFVDDPTVHAIAVRSDGGAFAGAFDEEVRVFGADLVETQRFAAPVQQHPTLFFANGDRHLVCAKTATASLWDLRNPSGEFTLITACDGAAAIVDPTGHWLAPRSALAALTVVQGDRGYPAAQFDLDRNRPDLVLAGLGLATAAGIERNRQRVRARWRELGRPEEESGAVGTPPSLSWRQQPSRGGDRDSVTLSVHATAGEAPLTAWSVYADNVPILDASRSVPADARSADGEFVVPLRHSDNLLRVEVRDAKGLRSMALTARVRRDGVAPPVHLWVLGIGVDDYPGDEHDLRYSVSDARRLAAALEATWAGPCSTRVLADTDSTHAGMTAATAFLRDAGVDDVVVVFLAGHGFIGAEGQYLFGCQDVDFAAPEAKGFAYAELERLLASTQARRRLLLLDTCRAGRPGAAWHATKVPLAGRRGDPVDEGAMATVSQRGVDPEDSGPGAVEDPLLSLSDLGEGVGATVLAAAGGTESALEVGSLRGGLFTHALCDGLSSQAADLDRDQRIRVLEWMRYAQQKVVDWSGGRQVPGLRRDNLEFDVVVAGATRSVASAPPLDDFEVSGWAMAAAGKSILLYGDGGALLRDRSDGSVRWRVPGPQGGFHGGWFANDGTAVMAAAAPAMVLLGAADGRALATCDTLCLGGSRCWSNGDAAILPATIFGDHVQLWHTGALQRVGIEGLQVADLRIAPNGLQATLLGMAGEVYHWDFADGRRRVLAQMQRPTSLAVTTNSPMCSRLSPGGHHVIGTVTDEHGGRLFVWDAQTGALLVERAASVGRNVLVLPAGVVEVEVGRAPYGEHPLCVTEALTGRPICAAATRSVPAAEDGIRGAPNAWVDADGDRPCLFLLRSASSDNAPDRMVAAASATDLVVIDLLGERQIGWLALATAGENGDEWPLSELDLIDIARVDEGSDDVVWVDRRGGIHQWALRR